MKFKHLFIVTYGRSGSTLLTGIVNAFPGYHISGENNNFLYGLYLTWKSLQNPRLQRLASQKKTSPWFGYSAYKIEEYETFVCELLRKILLRNVPFDQKNADVCLGFKEIRWFDRIENFAEFMDFLIRSFPETGIIFNRRKHEDVARSGWWRRRSPDVVADLVQRCDEATSAYHVEHPENTLIFSYDRLVTRESANCELDSLAKFLGGIVTDQVFAVLNRRHSFKSFGDQRPRVILRDGKTRRTQIQESSDHLHGFLFEDIDKNALRRSIRSFCESFPSSEMCVALNSYQQALEGTEGGASFPENFNRVIWTYWDDGLSSAPDVVKLCVERWSALNMDFSLKVLSKTDLDKLFPSWQRFASLPVAAFSDVLRVHLLAEHGGVWADATVVPLVPLNWWLPKALEGGFFAFSWGKDLVASTDGNRLTNASWFLAGTSGQQITRCWYSKSVVTALDLISRNPETLPVKVSNDKIVQRFSMRNYFWLHKEFTELVGADEEFRKAWTRCYELPACLPFCIGRRDLARRTRNGHDKQRSAILIDNLSPMLKLSYKYDVLSLLGQIGAERAYGSDRR